MAAGLEIRALIQILDVLMIVSLHAGTSIKPVRPHALVVTDKMDAAVEIGAEASPTQSCSHGKEILKLSFFRM